MTALTFEIRSAVRMMLRGVDPGQRSAFLHELLNETGAATEPRMPRAFVPASDRALTDRQVAVLVFLATFIRTHGYPPTLRDIGRGLGITSTNGVNDHLRALERKGCIGRDALASRGTRLTAKGRSIADSIEAARVARSA